MLGKSFGESAGNFAGLLEVSTLGGLTSEAVGGNFSDGFESAASGYAFNQLKGKLAVLEPLYKKAMQFLNKVDKQNDKLDSDASKKIVVPRAKYPEGTKHIEDAQTAGQPSTLTMNNKGHP